MQIWFAGNSTPLEVIKEALRQHDEEVAEQEPKSMKTIRLVGSKASASSVKEASKRLRIEFDHAHALTPSFKQVHIFKLAKCVFTCRAEVQQLHGMAGQHASCKHPRLLCIYLISAAASFRMTAATALIYVLFHAEHGRSGGDHQL